MKKIMYLSILKYKFAETFIFSMIKNLNQKNNATL